MVWRLAHVLPVAVAALLLATPASADDAADTATARALGIEGVTLANAGNCKDAVEKLERAEKLHHAPTTATRLGECEIELGKLVRGTERLQRVIREPLSPTAHAAFTAAVARAHKLLETTLPRLATIRVTVNAPPGSHLLMSVDDEPASDAIVDTDRAIDPGPHTIKVSAEGLLTSTASTSLAEGQSRSLLVELHRDPNAPVAGREADNRSAPPIASETKGSKVPAFVAFGASAVGLGVGIYAAVVVDRKTNALSNNCDANHVCPTELQRDIRDAKTWASVSTAGFVTAGVGAAAGVVLLLVSGSSAKATKTGLTVRPTASATSVGVDGVF
jgi:hypothetical protein